MRSVPLCDRSSTEILLIAWANAIVLQAVKDYKSTLHELEENPRNKDAQKSNM